MRSAVLFVVFNRPETTREVFGAIRAARPPRLYVAADGPRAGRRGEAERSAEVRGIATAVDWPCEVNTLFRDRNLGCKMGVSGAIDWFFDHEDEGIILEDDVLPLPGFFEFCDELLARYRDDEQVAMISGCNLISNRMAARDSYFFSRYTHIWGWASWRRAWRHYDVALTDWPRWRDSGGLERVGGNNMLFSGYWRKVFNAVHAGKIDTWDYQWTFACWRAGGLSVISGFNQTTNLGFGTDATHTTAAAPQFVLDSPVRALDFPLTHPTSVVRNGAADQLLTQVVYGITWVAAIKECLLSMRWIGKFFVQRR